MYIQLGLLTEYVDPPAKNLRPPLQVEFLQYWKRRSFLHPRKHHDDFVRIIDGDPGEVHSFEIKQPVPANSAAAWLYQGEALVVRSSWRAIHHL